MQVVPAPAQGSLGMAGGVGWLTQHPPLFSWVGRVLTGIQGHGCSWAVAAVVITAVMELVRLH